MGRYSDSDESYSHRHRKRKKKQSSSSSSSSPGSQSDISDESQHTAHHHSSRSKKSQHKRRSSGNSKRRNNDKRSHHKKRSSGRHRVRSSHRVHRSPSSEKCSTVSRGRRRRRSKSDSSEFSRSGSTSSSGSSHMSRSCSREGSEQRDRNIIRSCGSENNDALNQMTQTEHAKSLTKLALEAAASSDVALRQGSRVSQPLPEISPMGRQHFSAAVSLIDTGSFVSLSFKSSRSLKALKENLELSETPLCTTGMFGAVGNSVVFTKTEPLDKNLTALENDPETLCGNSLKVDADEKMRRWIHKLTVMRQNVIASKDLHCC